MLIASQYADWAVAAGTAALAAATFVLAWQARSEARKVAQEVDVSRAALEAQVRPILIDVAVKSPPGDEHELVHYQAGVPDTDKNVGLDAVDVRELENGNFACSVPFRNAGAGLAFITADPRLTHPARDTDLIGQLTKQVVPPGEQTRAVFGPGIRIDTPDETHLIAKVEYADTSESTVLWTEFVIQKKRNIWRVVQVSIGRDGEDEPFVVSAAAV